MMGNIKLLRLENQAITNIDYEADFIEKNPKCRFFILNKK